MARYRSRYKDQPPVPFEEVKRRALQALAQTSRDWLTVSAIGQACWPAEPDEWPRRFRTTQGYAFAAGKVVSELLSAGFIEGREFGYRITPAGRLELGKLRAAVIRRSLAS